MLSIPIPYSEFCLGGQIALVSKYQQLIGGLNLFVPIRRCRIGISLSKRYATKAQNQIAKSEVPELHTRNLTTDITQAFRRSSRRTNGY